MKLFKNPVFAVLIAIIIIFSSTVVSVNLKLGNKCQEIIDGFYDGVTYNGKHYDSIADQLSKIVVAVEDIISVSENYGVNTVSAEEAIENLKLSVRYSGEFASYIYYCYEETLDCSNALLSLLYSMEINERDIKKLDASISTISDAQSLIGSSKYNETVREFLRDEIKFPADIMASIAGVTLPEYFA